MADTIQIVCWSLQYSCKLRSGAAVEEPRAAMEALSDVRYYAKMLREPAREFGVFGDICVTSYTYPPGKMRDGKCYPAGGYRISERFKSSGGVEDLFSLCGNCPANTSVSMLAGCTGSFYHFPDSEDLDRQLRGIIQTLGLEDEFVQAFPATTLVWYGLWARTPVPPDAMKILRRLLSTLIEENNADIGENSKTDSRRRDFPKELAKLIRAVDIAERHSLPLNVSLMPPGHTDFGFYTIFPHCPFCKAAANVGRWQRKYPAQFHTCEVCGTQFSPTETASRTTMDLDEPELRDVLGQEAFENFAREYLIINGASPDEAREIVVVTEEAVRERNRKGEERRRKMELQRRYIAREIYKGLTQQKGKDGPPGFGAADFAEILKRCEAKQIKIVHMGHYSEDGDKDRSSPLGFTPDELFSEWIEEGCDGLFSANYTVPDELLAAFEAANPQE